MAPALARVITRVPFLDRIVSHPRLDGFATETPETPPAVQRCLQRMAAVGPAGDYYEFGLYRGYSFWYAQRAAGALGLNQMQFFGFDSFRGLPAPEGPDSETMEFRQGDYACGRTQVETYLTRYGVDWSRTHLIEGYFDASLQPELKQSLGMRSAAVVLVDCDLYSSTVSVLEFIRGLLRDGSILLFDDWNCFDKSDELGERRAFREFLERHPSWRAEPYISFGWHGQAFVLRKEGE
jgi:hypothetical protein